MPYHIVSRKRGGKKTYVVVNTETGEPKNKKPLTKEEALAFLRALYANIPDASKPEENKRMPSLLYYPASMDGYLGFLKDVHAHEQAIDKGIAVPGYGEWLDLRAKHNPHHVLAGWFTSGGAHGGGGGGAGHRVGDPHSTTQQRLIVGGLAAGAAAVGAAVAAAVHFRPRPVTKPAKTPETQSPEAVATIRQKMAGYHEGDRKVAAVAAIKSSVEEKHAAVERHREDLKQLGEEHWNAPVFGEREAQLHSQIQKKTKDLEKAERDLTKEQARTRDEVAKAIGIPRGEAMKLQDRSNRPQNLVGRTAVAAASILPRVPTNPLGAGVDAYLHLSAEGRRATLKKTTREAADFLEKVTASSGTAKVKYSTHPLNAIQNTRPYYVQSGLFNQNKVQDRPRKPNTHGGIDPHQQLAVPPPPPRRGPRGFGIGDTRIVGLSPLGHEVLKPAVTNAARAAARATTGILVGAHLAGNLANSKTLFLHTSNTSAQVAHELGHMLEHQVPGWNASAQAFLKHRVGDEPLTQLRSLPGGKTRYDRGEYGRKDNFDKAFGDSAHYVGKDHGKNASEVTSMGLEKLFTDPVGFARKDPEHAKFIMGMLDGSLRMPKGAKS